MSAQGHALGSRSITHPPAPKGRPMPAQGHALGTRASANPPALKGRPTSAQGAALGTRAATDPPAPKGRPAPAQGTALGAKATANPPALIGGCGVRSCNRSFNVRPSPPAAARGGAPRGHRALAWSDRTGLCAPAARGRPPVVWCPARDPSVVSADGRVNRSAPSSGRSTPLTDATERVPPAPQTPPGPCPRPRTSGPSPRRRGRGRRCPGCRRGSARRAG